MTQALIVTLAKDVVEQLNKNQGGWVKSFQAVRKYQPTTELENTDCLVCQVAAAAVRTSPDNRTDWGDEYDIDIGLMYRASPKAGDEATAKFDDVLLLAQQIAGYWKQTRPTIADCPLTGIAFGKGGDQPYIPEHIQKHNQLTTIITLTFTDRRDPD